MNREFIEDLSGNVSCILPKDWQGSAGAATSATSTPIPRPAAKRIVKERYYWCGFCQTCFDYDYPSIDVSPNDGRARCPNDHHRLELKSADIEVG